MYIDVCLSDDVCQLEAIGFSVFSPDRFSIFLLNYSTLNVLYFECLSLLPPLAIFDNVLYEFLFEKLIESTYSGFTRALLVTARCCAICFCSLTRHFTHVRFWVKINRSFS